MFDRELHQSKKDYMGTKPTWKINICIYFLAIQVFLTSVYVFANTLSAGCAHALVYAQFNR